mgnify:CR=1 FL=1
MWNSLECSQYLKKKNEGRKRTRRVMQENSQWVEIDQDDGISSRHDAA